jgi:hypothetical protein
MMGSGGGVTSQRMEEPTTPGAQVRNWQLIFFLVPTGASTRKFFANEYYRLF